MKSPYKARWYHNADLRDAVLTVVAAITVACGYLACEIWRDWHAPRPVTPPAINVPQEPAPREPHERARGPPVQMVRCLLSVVRCSEP